MAVRNPKSHEGHRKRLRDKFLVDKGFGGFSKHNIIELLLFYSIPRADTNELAHLLLDTFGSLKGIFDAPVESLLAVEGVGENTATLIKLIPALVKAYLDEDVSSMKYIYNTQEAVKFLSPKFLGLNNEAVVLVCLDSSHRILKHSFLGQGGIDAIAVDVRKIAAEVLTCNANTVILAHNHPGGICAPSKEDADVTRGLANFLSSLNVRLMDHIIFTKDGYFSFLNNPKFSYVFAPRVYLHSDGDRETQFCNEIENGNGGETE